MNTNNIQKGVKGKMQIAICDDEKEFRDELKARIIEYRTQKLIATDIYEFNDGQSLLKSNQVFDIIFIDYQMPGLDGLETAKILREKNFICSIIFITNYPSFVFKSFEVQPFRFFKKPLDKDELYSAMDSYLRQQKLLNPIMIVEDGERKIIQTEEIIYIEGHGKGSVIRTKQGTINCSKNLSTVYDLLPMHCFYRIHKSYIVNMYCIISYNRLETQLINGEKTPISRTKSAEFKESYKKFVKNYYVRW